MLFIFGAESTCDLGLGKSQKRLNGKKAIWRSALVGVSFVLIADTVSFSRSRWRSDRAQALRSLSIGTQQEIR
jgi:hypothetical protein